MRRATLLALSLILIGIWAQNGAKGQSSAAPPVSLAPPKASPPHAGTKNSLPREPSPPVIGALPAQPNPAADYDGFSVRNDDEDAPSQVTPPATSRAAKSLDSQSLVDQEDEALKRKLTICKNCK